MTHLKEITIGAIIDTKYQLSICTATKTTNEKEY
jgi:hypothetical protein